MPAARPLFFVEGGLLDMRAEGAVQRRPFLADVGVLTPLVCFVFHTPDFRGVNRLLLAR